MNWQIRRGLAALCVAAALGLLAVVTALGGGSAAGFFTGLATLTAVIGLGVIGVGLFKSPASSTAESRRQG